MSEGQGPGAGALDPHSYSGVFGVPQMKPYNELIKWETSDRVEYAQYDYPNWELGYDGRGESTHERDTHYRPWEKPQVKQESQSDNENKTPPTLTQLTNAFPGTYVQPEYQQKLPSFQSQFTSFPPEPAPPPSVEIQYNRAYMQNTAFIEDQTPRVHGIVFQNGHFPNNVSYNNYNVIPANEIIPVIHPSTSSHRVSLPQQQQPPTELPPSVNSLIDQNGYKSAPKKKRVQKKEIHQVDQVSTSTHDFKKPNMMSQDKSVKKKRKRCGECIGCQRKDNCGECAPCRNDKSHQICKQRRCDKLTEKKTPKSKMKQQQQ